MKKLFHFTGRHHVDGIRLEGLTKGSVMLPILEPPYGRFARSEGIQWLTDDPTWTQPWAVRVLPETAHGDCDRTEIRLTFKFPTNDRLRRWLDFAEELVAGGIDRKRIDIVNGHGISPEEPPLWGDSYKHWWIYGGTVPPRWISDLAARPKAAMKAIEAERLRVEENRRAAGVPDRPVAVAHV